MKTVIVNIEDGVIATGFRKMAAFVRRLDPETEVCHVASGRGRNLTDLLFSSFGDCPDDDPRQIDEIARGLAHADLIGYSSMTGYAPITKAIAKRVRELSPRTYQIWGGIHPIIHPEDAVTADVDAICTGEGEFAFEQFFDAYRNGKDFTQVKNFWFKSGDKIIRNGFLPLMTAEQMENLPFALYADGTEKLYQMGRGQGFKRMGLNDYLLSNCLCYNAIWSIGCPFACTYCGNTKFIANDAAYKKLRHPSARYMIDEIKGVLKKHPYMGTIGFQDDSFMAIPYEQLEEFAILWRAEVGIPFAVYGLIPNFVRQEKLEVLTWAGMNRIRMGIQNGSQRILDFYKRPSPPKRVMEAAQVINLMKDRQIPPTYDIIVDNPIETREDVQENLRFLYDLPRPYTFNIYSLKVIPNTELERMMKEAGVDIEEISSNYTHLAPTFANVLIYLLTFYRPPRWIWDRLVPRARELSAPQPQYPALHLAMRACYIANRGFGHLRFMDFSAMSGPISWVGYLMWRLGVTGFWRRRVRPLPAEPWVRKTRASGRPMEEPAARQLASP